MSDRLTTTQSQCMIFKNVLDRDFYFLNICRNNGGYHLSKEHVPDRLTAGLPDGNIKMFIDHVLNISHCTLSKDYKCLIKIDLCMIHIYKHFLLDSYIFFFFFFFNALSFGSLSLILFCFSNHYMPLYVLLNGPKIRNKYLVSCIYYF